MLKSRFNN